MTDCLNPEALASMADEIWIHANGEYGICDADRQTTAYLVCQDMADKFISAYLAALPAPRTITTVEELEALPYGSLVRANNGNEFYKSPVFDYPWSQGREHDRYASGYLAKLAPITVIHVPTEGGGDAT